MGFWFRCVDRRWPFLWEDDSQPPGRWHGPGEGPVHYLSSVPDAAWAEFLRHEGITDPDDLDGVDRSLWVIDIPAPLERDAGRPRLADAQLRGGLSSYPACQGKARTLRTTAPALVARSAALDLGAAGGERVDGGLLDADPRDASTLVVFGRQPQLPGWRACARGRPSAKLLPAVRPLN
jgi:hypothetical protein